MNKFLDLHSNERYVNYTINNYTGCYEDLSVKSVQNLTELFTTLKSHQLSIGNILVDKKPLQGVKLIPREQKEIRRNSGDLAEQLMLLGTDIDTENKKEVLFYQSVTHLCDAIQYLSPGEMIDLNSLFQNMHNYKQSLNDAIESDKNLFYPYNRYPKR